MESGRGEEEEEGAGWGAVCVSSALKRNKKDAWWEQPGWLHCVTDCRCERAPAQSSFRHATAAQPLFTPPHLTSLEREGCAGSNVFSVLCVHTEGLQSPGEWGNISHQVNGLLFPTYLSIH